MWRGTCPVRGEWFEGRVRTRRQTQNGKCQEGCSDGNAAAAAFSRAWAVSWESCPMEESLLCAEPTRSTAGCSWCLFRRFGSPPRCSPHSAQWLYQKKWSRWDGFRLLMASFFLGSKQYLLPHYLTHNGAQVREPFILGKWKGQKENSHWD